MKLGNLLSEALGRLKSLPMGVKVVLGVAVVAVVAVGSVFMYQAYDYVQHDNQFCLECHLMADPFERFAQSAHRGLGCKACHRPNILERSEMGLAQVIENPDSIRVHAHVPNQICAECHIEGDPDEWRRVANTAGHQIHLTSDDPALEGLNCVECHSSGVHQFTPTDQTCGQGGCHESTTIRLGEMADLTIHCATCHDFATPVAPDAPQAELASSLRPEAEECLSCHQMRSMLTDLPADEPHGAECGACHNPHDQATPAEAVTSCATGGCHESPDTLTPYHRGLDPGVLDNCVTCHEAHTFRIHGEGQDCLSCHQDIYQDAPGRTFSGDRFHGGPGSQAGTEPVEVGSARPIRDGIQIASAGPLDPSLARLVLAGHDRSGTAAAEEATGAVDAAALAQQADSIRFWHAQHQGVECTACHTMEGGEHGALTVTSLNDCRSCHHAEPVADDCSACHERPELRGRTFRLRRTMTITAGEGRRSGRDLPFRHEAHTDLECASCHTGGDALGAANVDCQACHQEHHRPDASCMACHAPPPQGAHDLEVHLGCAGSGCHEAAPAAVQAVPRTRDFCLACHQDMTSHRPGRSCERCHTLPQPQAALDPVDGHGPQRAEEP